MNISNEIAAKLQRAHNIDRIKSFNNNDKAIAAQNLINQEEEEANELNFDNLGYDGNDS